MTAVTDEHLISLQAGTIIAGRYEVVKCLGSGSMGQVYACRHRELAGHLVAIKVLFPEVAKDAVASARFRNEIVASYGVSHPNVVRAFEYFRDGELVAYTMEYVGGGDLAERLNRNPGKMPIPEIVRFLTQVTAGVQAIHDAGIIHRDLKPENIMLTEKGDVKITDFGIARTGHGPKLTEHGGVVGTIDYVSPEYLEKGQVDFRSDIYAIGVLGYEMITGQSPFRGDSVIATMTMRLRTDPKAPSCFRLDCPPELDQIILRAMQRYPEQRYQRAGDVCQDLGVLLDRFTQQGLLDPNYGANANLNPKASNNGRVADPQHVTGTITEYGIFDKSVTAGQGGNPSGQPDYSGSTFEAGAQEPIKMESVLSSSLFPKDNDNFYNHGPTNVNLNKQGIDNNRMRSLSRSLGEVERPISVDIFVALLVIFIAFGVGVAMLNFFKPDFFNSRSPFEREIKVIDEDLN